ncbi:hypothetical protein HanRHA438_Chr05g0217931 [Helianthus annuus]|uniref:Uncharacterized protein n=1 Tax=Helianthus annuus TaxID=4232 RepID=A0A9K3IYK2_HELAN|nr:hypothetical protein HanXRQr2_Chr05g0208471 [Helianthus annuus]KAJ0569816.1 hypothetical protein HanHA300_Chr05g0170881 [Helianthus annuus]KAJ0584139.1 hypothetical protein HanHA89_Chr05g0185081 [Helianthus annuus]KAJ0749806.1 hypothetical protein HanLR1_Chr05g0174451 [Helianthus annuus]KAJ0918435.1 hypothetical protein HanRHA438_Chr05g0217931 [Helianthus annuus]
MGSMLGRKKFVRFIGRETVAEAGTDMMRDIEVGTGIVTEAEVAAEVLIIAENVEEGDTMMIRAEVRLLTGVFLLLLGAVLARGRACLRAGHLLEAEVP